MKKAVIYLSLFLMVGVLSCRKVEKEQGESDKMDDSVARIEAQQKAAEEAAKAEAERARLDSLRQDSILRETNRKDSIAQEEKMRITPLTIERGVNTSVLKNLGFIKISEYRWHEGDLDGEDIKYSRSFNGRRVEYISSSGGSSDNYFQFFDSKELNDFKKALKKSQFKHTSDGVYSSGNHWIKIEGNKVRFDFDW